MKLIENLNWRYATKYFDTSKKVNSDNLELLKEAIRLSPSSYGLQQYKVLIVEKSEIKEQLKEAAYGQGQLTDSSHVFVFCHYLNVSGDMIDNYIEQKAKAEDVAIDRISGYGTFIKNTVSAMDTKDMVHWSRRQTYLAVANLLTACAELKIDACPMEGFEHDRFDDILGLADKGLASAIIVPVGYRSDSDQTQFVPKVRKATNEMFETI
ncbi:NAD(P)H-dependent oxidoreductase [Reichenbachiella sp.]|uniref:NAD(P)H-dependent oxidoreductase n=1 Tax=Reichenbachiella sp. TaxID=2184521 RepID=UPI003BB1260B